MKIRAINVCGDARLNILGLPVKDFSRFSTGTKNE